MAMTADERAPRLFHPVWPTARDIDWPQTVWSYDRLSDTMMVHFYGRGQPAVSVPLDLGDHDYVYARVDPLTEAVVGVQVEDFLAYAVAQHPYLLDALDFAELHGIAPGEVAEIRRQVAAFRERTATAASMFEEFAAAS